MKDGIVTLRKVDSLDGVRITYQVVMDYDLIGTLYQPKSQRRWWLKDTRENVELWQFGTRAEAIEHLKEKVST